MTRILQFAALAMLSVAVAADCSSNTSQVMPWSNLTAEQKSDYLSASVCLTESPATVALGNSSTIWDEFQYLHSYQVSWIHFVGQFLPWHRYFVSVHRNYLRDTCGYTGPIPYWDEVADSSLSNLTDSIMFQDDSFGGNGVGAGECIANGPFVNVTMAAVTGPCSFPGCNDATAYEHCIFRDFSTTTAQEDNQALIDECLAETTFEDAWDCIENGPHANGHGAIGGLMGSVAYSPGDPMFFLHHAFIDLLWWRWQVQDLSTRLTAIGGTNQATEASCETQGEQCPGASILDYDGDPGNTTTLNHVLWMMGVSANVTVADVMNINSTDVCLEYYW